MTMADTYLLKHQVLPCYASMPEAAINTDHPVEVFRPDEFSKLCHKLSGRERIITNDSGIT
jgi:hypothetical protein